VEPFSHPRLELARRLRNAMLDRGYSVEALARAVAVHMPDRVVEARELEAFLSGLAMPLPTERAALASALGIDIDQLQAGIPEATILEVKDLENGNAMLRISQPVTISVAHKIQRLLEET
jgi:transcriptional regulator with XRE-family HTH domain